MPTAHRSIWLIAVAETLVWSGLYYAFPALFVHWEQDFGWSKTTLTGAVTLAILASAVISPVVGRLIDQGYGRFTMTASAALGGILMLALALVDGIVSFYAIWIGIGIAMGGCLYEPCFALITRSRGAYAVRPITLVTLVAGFAGTLSFPIGHIMSEHFGWQGAAMVYGGLILFVAVPLFAIATTALAADAARHTTDIRDAASDSKRRSFLTQPAFLMLAAGFTLLVLNHGIVLNHLLPLLIERGISSDTAVLTAALIGPMQVAGRIAMMLSERHISMNGIMLTCFAGIAGAALFLMAADIVPAMLAGFVLLQGASFGVMSIVKPAITRQVMGASDFGAINGAMAVPYLTGVALAPFLGAVIWQIGGYDLVLPAIFVFALAGGISAYLATQQ